MASITFERAKLDTTDTYSATIALSTPRAIGNRYYIPVTIDEFNAPNYTVSNANGVATQSTLTSATSGAFDNVRVGDTFVSSTGLTLDAIATTTVDVVTATGSLVAIYDAAYTSSNLPVRAGDVISGLNIPGGTIVDKIDYTNKLLYLDTAATADGAESATVAPPVRVTAVRNSEWPDVATRNQIDIDTTIATVTLSDFDVVFKPGSREALLAAIRVSPLGSATTGTISIEVSGYKNSGENVMASNDGTGVGDFTAYNYLNLGNLTMNADEFLLDARVPRL